VTIASTWDTNGASGFFRFGGANDQILTSSASISNTVSSTKTGGSITSIGNVSFTKNSTVTFASGVTVNLNGYNFALTGGYTMSNGSVLKLKGSESSVTTPTLNTGSTVEYYGTTNSTLKNWSYKNLVINSTSASTVFTFPAALTISTTTISSGILSLNGNNFTTTNFSNDGTLRLRGSEILTITNPDLDSGTFEYVGDGNGVANNFYISDRRFYNFKINAVDSTDQFYLSGTDSGLKFWYKGEDNANDSVSGNNGTAYGGVAYSTTAKVGKSFYFDGSDDYILTPGTSTTYSAYTIGMWARPASRVIGSATYCSASAIKYIQIGGSYVWQSGGAYNLSYLATVGQWDYLTLVETGSLKSLYVNGNLVATSTSETFDDSFFLGKRYDNVRFNGYIDEVKIYDRALSSAEVSALYNGTNISQDIFVAGSFEILSGNLNSSSSNLNLVGADQTVSLTNDTTVASLTKIASTTTPTLTFGTVGKLTITGTTTLQGENGNNLLLRSSSDGTQWKFDPQGTRTLQYLDVKDSWNTNATAINTANYTGLVNSGNNTGWTFGDSKPVLSSISPTSGSVGALITLTATGSNFVSGSYIKFGSRRLTTSYVDAQNLTAQFNLTTAGSFNVTVTTDNCSVAPASCTSDPQTFTVNPILSITSITPAQVDAGTGNTQITINGTNFTSSPATTAYFSTTALSTSFVRSTQLTATIPSDLLTTNGTFGITVTSNSITSNAQPFTVGEIGYKAFIYTKTFYGSASLRK